VRIAAVRDRGGIVETRPIARRAVPVVALHAVVVTATGTTESETTRSGSRRRSRATSRTEGDVPTTKIRRLPNSSGAIGREWASLRGFASAQRELPRSSSRRRVVDVETRRQGWLGVQIGEAAEPIGGRCPRQPEHSETNASSELADRSEVETTALEWPTNKRNASRRSPIV